MKYVDDFISFEIPDHLSKRKVKKCGLGMWLIETPNEMFSIRIDFGFVYKGMILSATSYGNPSAGMPLYHVDGPHRTEIGGYEAFYRFLFGEVMGSNGQEFVPGGMLTICKEDYSVTIEMNIFKKVRSRSFPLDQYMPSISSIEVLDIEKLRRQEQKQQARNAKRAAKPPKTTITCDAPPGFEGIEPDVSPIRIKYQRDGMCIQIYNFTGLGREADIDLLEDDKLDGIEDDTTVLFPVDGAKCMVQNMEEEAIDFRKCKCLNILLARNDKCFNVIFSSDNEFDLHEYSGFLESMGKKKKK